jgi:hypothetical protein
MVEHQKARWQTLRLTTLWHVLSVLWLAFGFLGFEEPVNWPFGIDIAFCLGNLLFLAAAAWGAKYRGANRASIVYLVLLIVMWHAAPAFWIATEWSDQYVMESFSFGHFIRSVLPASVSEGVLSAAWDMLHIGYYLVMRRILGVPARVHVNLRAPERHSGLR